MEALAASVAHEINNPIAWVLGNLSLIKQSVLIHDPKKLQELVDECIQGAERIRDIVSNLKGFARINDKEIVFIDLHHILDSVLKMSASEISQHARIEKKYAPDMPIVKGNTGKLHQVFLNLIMNAVQAIPKGNVKNNKISISTSHEKNEVRIDISDTGSGIESDKLNKIFEPFYTTKVTNLGTGLGLSISYEIIKNMGGKITVKSELGKGSTFAVYLPIHAKFWVL